MTLLEILSKTTRQFRKGPAHEERQVGPLVVEDIYMMPHVDECPAELEKVDVGVPMVIGVDKAAALPLRDELMRLLLEIQPKQEWKRGPSYISVGSWLGSQDAAFSLFALGEVVGLWVIVTPQRMGATDEEQIRRLAGAGYVMISGMRDV